jgi:hypothetical protein
MGERGWRYVKRIGLLVIALVLTLGAVGISYAAWTDTIVIDGTVDTGEVCVRFKANSWGEVVCSGVQGSYDPYPDKNWSGWVKNTDPLSTTRSCPSGYIFDKVECTDKDVAYVTINTIKDGDNNDIVLEVTIHNAYPHLLVDISFYIENCGNIPVRIKEPIITQSDFLLIVYGDNIGAQLHDEAEISFLVGVVQHQGYWDNGNWVVDDPAWPLTPENNTTDLTFTITIPVIQWNEYVPGS